MIDFSNSADNANELMKNRTETKVRNEWDDSDNECKILIYQNLLAVQERRLVHFTHIRGAIIYQKSLPQKILETMMRMASKKNCNFTS